MKPPIIIFSSHDTSRDFPSQCPSDGSVTFLDWYDEISRSSYMGSPPPSFPAACVFMTSAGVTSTNMVGIVHPTTWQDVQDAMSAEDNSSMLSGICKWGTYQGGSYIGDQMDIASFEGSLFNDPNIAIPVKLNLPLTYPLIERYATTDPTACQQYWGLLKEASGWLDANSATIIEQYAVEFNIPILP